jgi:hypothetical protein
LKRELKGLKSRFSADETVEIGVDALVRENAGLCAKIEALDRRAEELGKIVLANQTDCRFLGNWLKREQPAHGEPEEVFKALIQRIGAAREELRRLQTDE